MTFYFLNNLPPMLFITRRFLNFPLTPPGSAHWMHLTAPLILVAWIAAVMRLLSFA